jgi:hypothetical protein
MHDYRRSLREVYNEHLFEQEILVIMLERLLLSQERLKIESRRHLQMMKRSVQDYENTVSTLQLRMEFHMSTLLEKSKQLDELHSKFLERVDIANEAFAWQEESKPLIDAIRNLEFQVYKKSKREQYNQMERLRENNFITNKKVDTDRQGNETMDANNSTKFRLIDEECPTACSEESMANLVPQNVQNHENSRNNRTLRKKGIRMESIPVSKAVTSKTSNDLSDPLHSVSIESSQNTTKTLLLEKQIEENACSLFDLTQKLDNLEQKVCHDSSLDQKVQLYLLKSLQEKTKLLQKSDVDYLAFQAKDMREMMTWIDFLIKRRQQHLVKRKVFMTTAVRTNIPSVESSRERFILPKHGTIDTSRQTTRNNDL